MKYSYQYKRFLLTKKEVIFYERNISSYPFLECLGIKFEICEDVYTKLIITEMDSIHRRYVDSSFFHGGVMVILLESAIGFAGLLHHKTDRIGVIEFSSKIIKPLSGIPVVCVGGCISKSGINCFCESKIFDSRNRLCAFSSGVIARASTKTNVG